MGKEFWKNVKLTDRIKIVLYSFCLAGCVGLALTMSIIVINSWSGGPNGAVDLTFNVFHERLIESIIFPLWTVMGFIASYGLLKLSCDIIHYRKTIEHFQQQLSQQQAQNYDGQPQHQQAMEKHLETVDVNHN